MPRKAFLKKKSLLDRFKDDYATHTGYIQSARAKHTWNNPLTRRKRTKELNKWIKSFAGKDHIHKLARFNATNAGRYESMYDEAMSLKGFLENLTEKLTKQFDLDLEEVQAYLNSHTQEMQELLNDTELSLKEKVLFVRSEITGEQDEKKSEKLVVSNPCVVYKGDAENAAKAHDYLYKKMPRVKGASISSDVKPLGNNKFCRVLFYGNNTGVMDLFGYYSNLYNDDFWNNCDADPQGWVDPLTINRYDVATPRQESKESAEYTVHSYNDTDVVHYEDGTPKEWQCNRCGGLEGGADGDPFGYYITNSKGKTIISPLCADCVDDVCDILNTTHGNINKALGFTESKKSEFYMDGDDSEDYYYCHRCGRVTPSYELDAHGGFCSDCDARWTAEHENESKKQTNEMIGNKKWVIRIKRLGKNYYVCSSSFRVNKAFRYPSLGGPFVCSDWDITERDIAKYDSYNDAKKAWDDMAQALRGGLPFYKEGEDYEIVQVNFSMMGESKKHEGYGGTKSVMSIWGNRPRDVYPEVSYSSVNDMYNTLLKYGYGDKHPIYYKNNSPEQIKGHILGYFKWTPTNSDADIEADALAAATMIKNNFNKSESKEPADEKLGYEKGHKNSRGEDAPWVIRSHEDNRVLASFAKKKDAEEHLKRMKQYSKTESKANEEAEINDKQYYLDMFDKAYKECVQLDIDDGGDGQNWADYFATGDDDPATFSQKEADEIVGYYMEFHPNGEGETDRPYKDWMANIDNSPKTALDKEITRILKALYAPDESKQSEASDLAGYTSDVISELDVVWACGENGAKRLADKYADVIQQNYTDGDLLASETAKFIAGQENLKESRNKSESKKSEGRLELVDTIIIPKWLWEAYNFGNDYGEDLDEHEQEILAKFQEKYSDLYLDDHDEEADFQIRNDFDEYGGPCYEVDVYEMKKA